MSDPVTTVTNAVESADSAVKMATASADQAVTSTASSVSFFVNKYWPYGIAVMILGLAAFAGVQGWF